MILSPQAKELEKILKTPLALKRAENGDTSMISPIGEITLKDKSITDLFEQKESFCIRYYTTMSYRIAQVRPPLTIQDKLHIKNFLVAAIENFLNPTNELDICKNKFRTYFAKVSNLAKVKNRFCYKVWYRKLNGRGKKYDNSPFFTIGDLTNFLIRMFPKATFFDARAAQLAKENLERIKKQGKVDAESLESLEKTLKHFEKHRELWMNEIKKWKFFPVKVKMLRRNGSSFMAHGNVCGGLIYRRTHPDKRRNNWEIVHGSGVVVMDELRSQLEAKIIVARLVSKFNWARSLTSLQNDPAFPGIVAFMDGLKKHPFDP